ncbi:hypothetical protein [uncultured Megasphaera sp.]|uniref:hypothetical protein n=1 Tax=uncultured Megasphaera sp. TaxID=165188 RepID=UPI0026583EA1|nr:hypothetical protein [uncultured Megasphaera sp.]
MAYDIYRTALTQGAMAVILGVLVYAGLWTVEDRDLALRGVSFLAGCYVLFFVFSHCQRLYESWQGTDAAWRLRLLLWVSGGGTLFWWLVYQCWTDPVQTIAPVIQWGMILGFTVYFFDVLADRDTSFRQYISIRMKGLFLLVWVVVYGLNICWIIDLNDFMYFFWHTLFWIIYVAVFFQTPEFRTVIGRVPYYCLLLVGSWFVYFQEITVDPFVGYYIVWRERAYMYEAIPALPRCISHIAKVYKSVCIWLKPCFLFLWYFSFVIIVHFMWLDANYSMMMRVIRIMAVLLTGNFILYWIRHRFKQRS